jgi:hypothetical protein
MNGRGVSLLRSKIVRIAFATALPWACSGPDFTEIAQPSVAAIDAGSDVDDTPIILPPGTTTVQSAVDAGDATVDAEAAGSAAPIFGDDATLDRGADATVDGQVAQGSRFLVMRTAMPPAIAPAVAHANGS